ncbi:ABC-type Fe3+-hydroxamate transport system substrate-binding protein [Silvimonas terrae]|uniref:ABC-type Fe3+-hydroxamate transport system substrate-binding protein n=2 Tax=Silvimonas terrae TaxID=300266 RepID=A0A840RIH2_9NEIS|nr:ABC-type Fe3+-hydroxamate transport system substrate-binding protein [Silvimonas terrae]
MMRFAVLLALLPAMALAAVQAKDDNGTLVELPQPAQRVITLAPHATELVAALKPEAIVAVDTASDYPESVKKLPKVATFQSLNIEAILAARPDLVVVWESQAVSQSISQLQRQHIPVFVSRPQTPQDVASSLRRLGALLGQDARADELASAQEARYRQLLAQYQHARPVRVYLQVSENPPLSLSRRSFLGQMLADCGATSPYANARAEAPQVSTEAVLAFAPELMLTTGERKTLDMWKAWPQIPAIKANRLVSLRSDQYVRPGPRMIEGMQKVCEQIDAVRH